jgi:hypothetical protein
LCVALWHKIPLNGVRERYSVSEHVRSSMQRRAALTAARDYVGDDVRAFGPIAAMLEMPSEHLLRAAESPRAPTSSSQLLTYRSGMAFAGHGGRRYVRAPAKMHARLAALLERMTKL